jgi:hypothetical protein
LLVFFRELKKTKSPFEINRLLIALRIFKPSAGPEPQHSPDQGQNGQKEVLPKGVGLTCDWDSKWGVNSPQEHHTDHGTYRVCARVHLALEFLVNITLLLSL